MPLLGVLLSAVIGDAHGRRGLARLLFRFIGPGATPMLARFTLAAWQSRPDFRSLEVPRLACSSPPTEHYLRPLLDDVISTVAAYRQT